MVALRPNTLLPWVWSPWKWVFTTKRTGFGVMPLRAASILGTRGSNWSSTSTTPSSPTETPMLPPAKPPTP
jgi:hypothetical protein